MHIVERPAKQIITKSNLPDTDYVVNPYVGCSFACSYCYASFMGRFVGHSVDEWGSYVYVKTNAVELFKKEIEKKRFSNAPTLFLSSVTDAWQGPEKKYRLTRGILKVLVEIQYPGRISILTKSPLIMRDFDLISQLKRVEVGVTVTTDNDKIGVLYEAQAPRNTARLEILAELANFGIPSFAFVGPLFTHYVDEPRELEKLIHSIAETKVAYVYAELLNIAPKLMRRLLTTANLGSENLAGFEAAQIDPQRRLRLASLVESLISKHGIELRLGRVLDHQRDSRSGG